MTMEEREYLVHISRARAELDIQVARTKPLLAVAEGRTYTEVRRTPDREAHGAATCSLTALQRALEGQDPTTASQIIEWLEATARGCNKQPAPFEWRVRAKPGERGPERGPTPWQAAAPAPGSLSTYR